jgi:hypothetical protein
MSLILKKAYFSKPVYIFVYWVFVIQIFAIAPVLHAQQAQDNDTIRKCYTDYMTRLLKDKFPATHLRSKTTDSTDHGAFYIIPVVVHVIHKNGVENISDDLIRSQIEVLNEDFGHYGGSNTDPRGADTRIRFCLAKIDPFGNPTTGINRIYSDYTDLISDNELLTKELSIWDPHKYMNFWIVRTIDASSTIQAYSFMPRNSGGPAYSGDGIVVLYKYFGRGGNFTTFYNLGKTAVHEAGHYFDLLHTWGRDEPGYGGCDDDDGIDDTPVCSLEYYSSPLYKCFHPIQCGNVRMIENYLDYSLDACMTLFTPGQANKMISTLQDYRSELVHPQNVFACGCGSIYDSLNNRIRIKLYPTLVNDKRIFLEIENKGWLPLTINIFDLYGRLLYTKGYEKISASTIEIPFSLFNGVIRPGVYILRGSYAGSFQRIFIVAAP